MKYLKGGLISICTIMILLFMYLEWGGSYIMKNTDKKMITEYLQSSNQLPQNFIIFYNTVYPKSLSQNSWDFSLTNLSQSHLDINECPCRYSGNRIMPTLDIQNKISWNYILLIRYIEQNYTQKDCLNFNFSNFDFLNNRKGIEMISQNLFNKSAEKLQPVEMAEILALYENPRKNDRYRNPEHTKNRTMHFYNLYLSNLKDIQ
ncbi:transglycosylase domain-containing protein [Chryseobacterium sp. JK1]|uniref:transglycosylase domain-containing protein n=1 Tax=Chryseobacterium sp. JK1 TaxID=874294 RepID=UPI003D68A187